MSKKDNLFLLFEIEAFTLKLTDAAGGSILDVVKFTIWIVDFTKDRHKILIKHLLGRFGDELTPTCGLIPVNRLAADGSLIEIEAMAY